MEAATAADLTQASEIAGRYITLGSRVMISKGYVSGMTVRLWVLLLRVTPFVTLGRLGHTFLWRRDQRNVLEQSWPAFG